MKMLKGLSQSKKRWSNQPLKEIF